MAPGLSFRTWKDDTTNETVTGFIVGSCGFYPLYRFLFTVVFIYTTGLHSVMQLCLLCLLCCIKGLTHHLRNQQVAAAPQITKSGIKETRI